MPRPSIQYFYALVFCMLVPGALSGQTEQHPVLGIEDANGIVIPKQGSVDFGSTAYAFPVQKTVTLKNTGSAPLTLGAPTKVNGQVSEFRINATLLNKQIAPGGSLALPITFEPGSGGPRSTLLQVHSDDTSSPYEITLTGTGLQAKLVVEQPTGILVNSGYVRDFGSRLVNSETTLTFNVSNTGDGPLSIVPFILPAQSSVFTITQAPPNPLPAGDSAIMTVKFSTLNPGQPYILGQQQADLRISTNDPFYRSGHFTLGLTGHSMASFVTLDQPEFHARQGDTSVPITLSRTNTGIPVRVRFRTAEYGGAIQPPYQPAIAGQDFVSIDGTEVYFATGEETQTVTLRLLPRTALAKKNLHFGVNISVVGAGCLLNRSFATVRINSEDTTKPSLTLTTPIAGKVSDLSPLQVTGKAVDANGIRRIEMRLNGGDLIPVTYDEFPVTTSVPFQASIAPLEGLNTLVVSAWDMRENVTTITRSFTFSQRHTVYVEFKNFTTGHSIPAFATLAFTATPSSGATAFTPKIVDYYRRRSAVLQGTRIKITATPHPGYAVHHWDRGALDADPGGLETPVPSAGNIADFVMPAHDTHIQVWLMPSPFIQPDRVANTMNWLLKPDPALTPSADLFASLNGALTSAGGFSGKLLIKGQNIPVVARLNGSGPASFTVGGKPQATLPFPGGELLIRGVVGSTPQAALRFQGGDTGPWMPGRWARYSSARKVWAELLNPKSTTGYYTFRLTPTAAHRPLPTDKPYPRAPGYATFTLSSVGQAKITGLLPDGTAFTTSTPLVTGDIYDDYIGVAVAPIFIPLATPGGTAKTSLLIGDVSPDAWLDGPNLIGHVQWYRPSTSNPKVLHYPQGWPQGFDLRVYGKMYRTTVPLQHHFDTTYTPGQPNLTLSISGGGLPRPIVKTQLVVNQNVLTQLPPADASYTLSISKTTGLVTGTFTPDWAQPASARPSFKGIIIYDDDIEGFFINNNAKNPPANGDGTGFISVESTP